MIPFNEFQTILNSFLTTCYGAKNIHKAIRGFLTKEDKTTLEAYRDSHAQAAGNYPSTKSKVPKIANQLAKYYTYSIIPKTFLLK
ncbi:unnamed protein product [Malus baccata var. baccata]